MKYTFSTIIASIIFTISAYCQLDAPDIQFVSINPYTNEISIAWNKSTSPSIAFTRLHYVFDESTLIKGKTIIDLQQNIDDTLIFKTDTLSIFNVEAQQAPLSFAVDVYAVNSDNTATLSEYHTTIHAVANYQTCSDFIKIDWSLYKGFQSSILQHEIIEVTGSNTETIIATLASSKKTTNIPINSLNSRRFYVKTYIKLHTGEEYTSNSNMVSVEIPNLTGPTFITNKNITVTNSAINISWDLDPLNEYTRYILTQKKDSNSTFKTIDTITVNTGETTLTKAVNLGSIQSKYSYYQLTAINSCNDSLISSAIMSPINLYGYAKTDEIHSLQINYGNIWPEGFESILLYRINDVDKKTTIADLKDSITFYSDNISNIYAIDPNVCYQIEAIQNISNNQNISNSNIFCIAKNSRIFMPNAFNPQSEIEENRVFKPKYAFVGGSFSMKIYNRTGSMIYETTDITKGWDGTIHGKLVPQGTYRYAVESVQLNGEVITKAGAVNLMYID